MKKIEKLATTAAQIGFNVVGAFRSAVVLFTDARACLPAAIRDDYDSLSKSADMLALVSEYQAGCVARSLSDLKHYAKKWGNYSDAQKIEEGRAILKLPSAKSDKPERRTEEQELAVRAASKSCSMVRDAAGFPKRGGGGRKPRPSSNAKDNATPPASGEAPSNVLQNDAPAFTVAAPKLPDTEAADRYFASAIAALLATADVNADNVSKPWSDFIADAYSRAVKAKLIPSADK